MKFIGITGGVGAGKSTVLGLLKENCNCKILLADEVAAYLMSPEHDCFDKVVALPWPASIKSADGSIDRPLMASYMFADDSLREKVNAIVHPAVKDYVLNQVETEKNSHNIEYFFFEAALLIECGYDKLVDEMWYIYTAPEVRRARLKDFRGYSDAKIDLIMASQRSDDEFRAYCRQVIDNTGTAEETLEQLHKILDNGEGA